MKATFFSKRYAYLTFAAAIALLMAKGYSVNADASGTGNHETATWESTITGKKSPKGKTVSNFLKETKVLIPIAAVTAITPTLVMEPAPELEPTPSLVFTVVEGNTFLVSNGVSDESKLYALD
jgi:hypothetical protein